MCEHYYTRGEEGRGSLALSRRVCAGKCALAGGSAQLEVGRGGSLNKKRLRRGAAVH